MDYKNIISLMKEMNHTDLTKLEIEEEGVRICIEKAAPIHQAIVPVQVQPQSAMVSGGSSGGQAGAFGDSAQVTAPDGSAASSAMAPGGSGSAAEKLQAEEEHKKIESPMVGTFYMQPSPDKPPFVKVGDRVKKGQTVCIIEAMKLMNEIESDLDGEIVQILPRNEQMVEYGQPLFLVK